MIIKNATGLPPGAKPMPSDGLVKAPAQSVQPQEQVGLGRKRTPESTERIVGDDERQAVINMQSILMALANSMNINKDSVASRFNITPAEVIRITGVIQDTGGQKSKALDGIWGNKTVSALNEVSKLAKAIGSSAINPGKHYSSVNPGNIISLAKANVDSIADLMNKVGFGSEVPKNVGVRLGRYDTVPDKIHGGNVAVIMPPKEGIGVQPKDLDNIFSFYQLATSLLGVGNLPSAEALFKKPALNKIAEIVKSASLFKIAQVPDSQERRSVPATVTGPEPQNRGGVSPVIPSTGTPSKGSDGGFNEAFEKVMKTQGAMTADKFEKALSWFYERASFILSRAQDRMFYEEDGKIVGSEEDVKNASEYRAAIAKLIDIWNVQKDDILKGKNPSEVVLNRGDLKQIPNPKAYAEAKEKRKSNRDQIGLGRKRTDDTKDEKSDSKSTSTNNIAGTEGFRIFKALPNGPLGPEIDLVSIMEYIPKSESLKWLVDHSDDLYFSYEPMRKSFGNLDNIVESYRADKSYPKKRFAIQLFHHLFQVIDDVFDAWKDDVRAMIRSGLRPNDQNTLRDRLEDQSKLADAWRTLLNTKKNQAMSWDVPMYDNSGRPSNI